MPSLDDCGVVARVVVAVMGVMIGVATACVFGAVYHNYHAASWGLASGVIAALTLGVHVSFMKGRHREDPSPFRCWMYCGCFSQLAGVTGFIVYLVLAIKEEQGLLIDSGPGYFYACIWCAMTWKWGFQLFYFSRSYWRRLTGVSMLLLPPTPQDQSQEKFTPAMEKINYGSRI